MKTKTAVLVALICAAGALAHSPAQANSRLPQLAQRALSRNRGEADTAIAALRAAGPAGLQALLEAGRQLTAENADDPEPVRRNLRKEQDTRQNLLSARFSRAVDEVGQQRDNAVSRLYWYTDLAKAKAAARAANKPILELRLLGRLTDVYSCANSRFFRAVLYPQNDVAKYLRENYVLYWQMVRPVPRVTIDFGDGRRIETTVTGNSIHYVQDSEGHPLEALPGMVAPRPFLRWLARSDKLACKLAGLPTEEAWSAMLRQYHHERLQEVGARYQADLAAIRSGEPRPDAEIALKAALTSSPALPAGPELRDSVWTRIASLHMEDANPDGVIDTAGNFRPRAHRGLGPAAVAAAPLAVSKIAGELPVLRSVLNFQRTVAQDTVFNEYALHRTIHQWFAEGQVTGDIETLNKKVYAELFQTPDSDPWLGLLPREVFTGLPNDGVVLPPARKAAAPDSERDNLTG